MTSFTKWFMLAVSLVLAGCSGTKTLNFDDGDKFEVVVAEVGGQSMGTWRMTDVQTGEVRTGNPTVMESIAARTIPGVATAVTGGLIQGVIALELDGRQSARCESNGCGTTGPSTVVQIGAPTATAVSGSESTSGSTNTIALNTCGMPQGTMCPGTMN